MNERSPESFVPEEEYENWDSHIQYWDRATALSAEEKERTRQAVQYLRQELGEPYIQRLFKIRHPFLMLFVNKAEWCRIWLLWFADALELVKEADNFKSLRKRIKAIKRNLNDELSEAASVLEVAYVMLKAGFKVVIDPKVIVKNAKGRRVEKKPDLKIIDEETEEEIFIEVSILGLSNRFKRASELSWPVVNLMHIEDVTIYAEMTGESSERSTAEAVRQLRELIAEVKASGELRTLINQNIKAGVAPTESEELKQWAKQNDVSPGIAGPRFEVNDLERAIGKLQKEIDQLPRDKPGLVVIPTTGSALFFYYRPEDIIRVLAEEMLNYPHVFALVLTQNHLGAPAREAPIMDVEPHAFINKTMADGSNEQIVIVSNQAFALVVSETTLKKVHKAFNHG